jgi:hypothetical protein
MLSAWGREYQADTEALDLAANAWGNRFSGNPIGAMHIVQGVCLFFQILLRIEQFRARVLRDNSSLWSPTHSH